MGNRNSQLGARLFFLDPSAGRQERQAIPFRVAKTSACHLITSLLVFTPGDESSPPSSTQQVLQHREPAAPSRVSSSTSSDDTDRCPSGGAPVGSLEGAVIRHDPRASPSRPHQSLRRHADYPAVSQARFPASPAHGHPMAGRLTKRMKETAKRLQQFPQRQHPRSGNHNRTLAEHPRDRRRSHPPHPGRQAKRRSRRDLRPQPHRQLPPGLAALRLALSCPGTSCNPCRWVMARNSRSPTRRQHRHPQLPVLAPAAHERLAARQRRHPLRRAPAAAGRTPWRRAPPPEVALSPP